MKINEFIIGVLLLCMISMASADTIQINDVDALNSSFHDIGWFASANLSSIEYMFLNFTINASADRIITNVSLNFTAYGAEACAPGNRQEDYCYNYYNTTSYKWIEFVNGTTTASFKDEGNVGDFIDEDRYSDGQNMTVTYLIDEHYNPNIMKHYSSDYNFSDVKWQSSSDIRLTKNNYIRALSGDYIIPLSADHYKLEARFNASTASDTDSIYAYLCNSTYNETGGDVTVLPECELVCSKSKLELDGGTKIKCLFTGGLLDKLGDSRNVSVVFVSDIPTMVRYFALKTYYSLNISHSLAWQYSSNNGGVWNEVTDGYETETNINYFYGGTNVTAFKYLVIATNNNSEKTVLEGNVTWDIDITSNYPPIISLLTPVNNDTLNLPVNITYDIADSSNDPLNVSLVLYNRDWSINTTIRENMNRSNISYYWDGSIDDGKYILALSVCETNTSELYCINDSRFMNVADIDVVLNFVIPLDHNFSYVPGFNSSNLEAIEYMLLNFTINAIGNTKIENVTLNFTAFGTSACSLGNKQSSICYNYYQNDTYKWIEFKNSTNTPTFDSSSLIVGDAIVENRRMDGNNMTITYLIDEHFNPNVAKAYDALFNYSDLKWQNTTDTRLTKNNMIQICSGGSYFPYDADQYRLDTRLNPSDTILSTDIVYGYVCNDTYNTTLGDPALNDNCNLLCQKRVSDLQQGEKFRCVFTGSVFDDIGPSKCVVLSTNIPNINRYFNLRTFKALNESRNFSWEYSVDSGDSWTSPTDGYETELNLNWFYDGINATAFIYNLKVSNNDSVILNSEGNLTWDIDPAYNYPPVVDITAPIYDEIIWFPYNITFNMWDPNNDNLNATLYHYHYNGTYEMLVTNMNGSNASFLHDENNSYSNISYILNVCELGTSYLYCVNSSINVIISQMYIDGAYCTEDINCSSSNCRSEINSSDFYCASAGKECSISGDVGYDVGDTNGSWICSANDTSYECTAGMVCDEYGGSACDGVDTWVAGSSDDDYICGLCQRCSGTGSNDEGDLACVDQDEDEDLFDQCGIVECDNGATTPYYFGWDTDACYYRLDVNVSMAACDVAGVCKDDTDYCLTQDQDGLSGIVCDYVCAQVDCSGIINGTCDTSLCDGPYFVNFTLNQTHVYAGRDVAVTANIQNNSIPLQYLIISYNGTQGNISVAVNGSNIVMLPTTGLLGNYTIRGYVNDTSSNYNYSAEVYVLVIESPILDLFSANASNVQQGDVVEFYTNVTEGYYSLSKVFIVIRDEVVNISDAVVGSNNFTFVTSGFYGNYSVVAYVNDSTGSFNDNRSVYLNINSLKGIVPEDSGEPFYTTSDNSYNCGQMWEGQSCEVTYIVNSTGESRFDYEFFAWANSTVDVTNVSASFYVKTIDAIPNSTGVMYSNDTLYCNLTYGDEDGDSVSLVNWTIGWYQNHTLLKNGSLWLNCTENTEWCLRGMNMFCFACVEDEHGYIGGCNQSLSLTVSNEAPSLTPYIIPSVPDDGDDLVCNENATDPENDTLFYEYMWFVDGSGSNMTSKTIGNLATITGDSWVCQVQVYDGGSYVKANSSAVVIGGACPTVPVLLYPPNWTQISGLPIEFDWTESTIVLGADVTYHLQTSDSSGFSTTITDISVIPSEYSSNDSYVPDTYYWRARAYANSCYSNWSDTWIFTFVNGTCNDGEKNFHDGEQEVGVDCGGSCEACDCASQYIEQVSVYYTSNATGDAVYVTDNITTLDALELHCMDGCFEPEFGESDTDCGGFGAWACPDCGIGQNCTSDYECADGLFCNYDLGVGLYGKCANNSVLSYCSNGIYNPTLNESDIDCGGPCDGCSSGDRCVSTLDCSNNLVCNQYDICQEQTDDILRKRGRQLGGVASRGLSMNQAFCSGVNDRYFQIPADEIYNMACEDADVESMNYGTRYTYVIDTTGLTGVWNLAQHISAAGKTPVIVYHIEQLHLDAYNEPVWKAIWHGSDGQEFQCSESGFTGDSECANLGVYSEKKDEDYVVGGYCEFERYASCYLCYSNCPDYCYHCDTPGTSDVFYGIPSDPINDIDILPGSTRSILDSGCLFVPLCKNEKHRLTARVLVDNGGVYQSYDLGFDTSSVTFTTDDDDGGVIYASLDNNNNKGFDDISSSGSQTCEMPILWDVGTCDGEGVSYGLFDQFEYSKESFFVETGCSWYDTAMNRWLATTTCGAPTVGSTYDDDPTSRLKVYPLSDFGCDDNDDDIVLAMLDFRPMYETHFKYNADSDFAYDPSNPNQAIHMLITREAINGQECLVYDNLLSNAYKYQPDLIGDYFNLYEGGESLSTEDPRYGPRIRLPMCDESVYNVLLYYIPDVSDNQAPSGHDTFQDYVGAAIYNQIVSLGYSYVDIKDLGFFGNFVGEIADYFTGWEPDCRKPDTTVCLDRGSIVDIMQENKKIKPIHVATFKLSDTNDYLEQNADVISRFDEATMCYADYRVNMNSVLNYGRGYTHDIGVDERYSSGVDDWLFGVVNEDRDGDGKPDGGMTATITDPNSWIDNFFTIFNPFDLRPPVGLIRDTDGNIVFSFETFFREMIGLLFTSPFQFVIVVFKIILFYIAKYLFWILLYALLSYLWTRAMPNISIYWLMMIFLFIAIVILGWWASYTDFVDMFKVI